MNTMIKSSTGSSPFALMFLRKPNIMKNYKDTEANIMSEEEWENKHKVMREILYPAIKERVTKSNTKRMEALDAKRKITKPLEMGNVVMVENNTRKYKTEPIYEGPYVIEKVTKEGRYILKDKADKRLGRPYDISQMKFVSEKLKQQNMEKSQIIKKIKDHRGEANNREYLVLWEDNTESWIPFKNFDDIEMINTYWRITKGLRKRKGKTTILTGSSEI